jgi:hypothetical protein
MPNLNPIAAPGVRRVAERELIFLLSPCELQQGVLNVVVNHAISS